MNPELLNIAQIILKATDTDLALMAKGNKNELARLMAARSELAELLKGETK